MNPMSLRRRQRVANTLIDYSVKQGLSIVIFGSGFYYTLFCNQILGLVDSTSLDELNKTTTHPDMSVSFKSGGQIRLLNSRKSKTHLLSLPGVSKLVMLEDYNGQELPYLKASVWPYMAGHPDTRLIMVGEYDKLREN